MIGTIASVIRGEGIASAFRRAGERIAESLRRAALLAHNGPSDAAILNVCGMPVTPRLGGVPIQLAARLRKEREHRSVALYSPGILEFATHARRVTTLREALSITGARAIHLEGTYNVDVDEVLAAGVDIIIVTLHDFTLTRRELLAAAKEVIAPSQFVLDTYGVEGQVIEPGVPPARTGRIARPAQIAFAGAVKRHKGAHLIPELNIDHVFGGGDEDLLRAIRAKIHGYYRAGTLHALLAKHRIGLVVLPSIVPETFSLTISESWLAGIPIAAFDIGAPAERIRKHGGGWLAPLDSGAAGLAEIIERWRNGAAVEIPRDIATPADAARAHLALYERWGLT